MKEKENDTSDDDNDARLKECRRIVRNRNGSVRKRSMFSEYANIFCITLARWTRSCNHRREDKSNGDGDDLILPSNEDWRYRVYYHLVELQRECGVDLAKKRYIVWCNRRVVASSRLKTEEGSEAGQTGSGCWEWEPKGRGYDLKALPKKGRNERSKMESLTSVVRIGGSMTEACVQPGWRVKDILLAAEVLRKVKPSPTYSDEAEMRRVFGLVYDVLRYKKVFTRALEDIGFWRYNAAIKDREKIVWLLLYDMQGRKFTRLQPTEIVAGEEREKIFKAAGLRDIEKALLKVKTHLAASISRLRIRGSALKLDELLPTRLRVIEGVSWASEAAIASGWINTEKLASKEEFLEEMSKLNFVCCCEEGDAIELEEIEYTFDPICPKMVNLHESARETLAVSTLVRDHNFIFLERSLCLGAATLARAIRNGRFSGPVVLTHSLAPRHTGYLAGLLADIEHAGRLLAFGAGDQRDEYETYLKHLGDVTSERCLVFSENYVAHPATSELERATVVLAVPTCSYTGVRDIVDLAVARGGDADLLESLTNAYVDGNDDDRADENYGYNNHEQWRTFMADQMSTLKYVLTRPNVQFVVYEVHTILPSETTVMVRDVVDCVNRMAEEKYIREHSRKPAKEGRYETERLDNDVESRGDDRASTITANVIVPDSDIFEVGNIEDIYGENVSGMLDPGCFLAIIKRKEMMQFDSVFMIDVAESKGLFGDPNVEGRKCPKGQQSTLERSLRRRSSQTSARKQVKRVKIDRLMAHTYSSLSRSTQEDRICPRHKRCTNWREIAELQVSEVSNNDAKTAASLSNATRNQKEGVNRTSAPVDGKSPRRKELRAIRSMFLPRSEFDTAALKRALGREGSSSILTNLLTVESLSRTRSTPKEEWRNSMSSSTILRSPILARAARRVPLETNENDVRVEEKIGEGSRRNHSQWTTRKTSRLLHPAGSPSNVLEDSFSFDLV